MSLRDKAKDFDPRILEAARAGGVSPSDLKHYWKKIKTEDGVKYSLFVKNPYSADDLDLSEAFRQVVDTSPRKPRNYPRRKREPKGDRLLVIDCADIHIGKLAVKRETGYEYNHLIAQHRLEQGTASLLKMARSFDIGRCLFVLGNDHLHVDNAQKKTTSGTPQDMSTSVFNAVRTARDGFTSAILQCAKKYDVDLVHCMSNHDWLTGWMLSLVIAGELKNHPNVHASEYALCEMHRKYYRFGDTLIGLGHGDGAKEEGLYGLMVKEAREHIGECKNLYWLLHHYHHKIVRKRGKEKPELVEKDHTGMTAIVKQSPNIEAESLHVEYVRSPSAPDSWHDRQGYCNRQAVEAFVFDPHEGMKARLTEWF